jgi:hypothetical protein
MCVPDMGSRRFCITTIQGVADSPTVCIVDTGVNNSKATLFQFQIGYLRAENGRLDVLRSSEMAVYELRIAG